MQHRRRREFLLEATRTALGLSLLPLAACRRSGGDAATNEPEGLRPPAPIAEIESEIPALLARFHVPGLSIALIENGRLAWSGGFGVKRADGTVAVDRATLFEAGSISKTVFAYAVMKLAEKGLLDLDKPLTGYLPVRWVDDPRFDRITARHVLSHTSGLQNWRSQEDPLRIHFTPGSQWLYSGEGYSYLQLVVASLTGRISSDDCETMFDGLRVCATEVDAFMKANLLRPFGMTASGYVWETESPDAAAAHDKDGRPTNRPGATRITAARYGAAGGLSTTAEEYARFLIEVIDPRPSDDFRLTRAGRDEMIRPRNKVGERDSYGLGWGILHHAKGDLITHGGDNPGFKAFTVASVERKAGLIILTNGDSGTEVIGELANGNTPLVEFVTG
jgi:CubicO group peptidase (beta-lactamase class C family)